MMSKASPTSHSYFSQRLRLHYLDWGNDDAPPLLLVHGSRDHCHNWDWLAQELRDEYHIVAPDFRGHGDSEWVRGASYGYSAYIYDLAQLVHQQNLSPVSIIAHSLGGGVALRYAGIYPEHIRRMIVIEGAGNWHHDAEPHVKMRQWIEGSRTASGRLPRRYDSLDDALHRMQAANGHLREDQARHLTIHGSNRNEDGSYSWKFDNYTRLMAPFDMGPDESRLLWNRIDAPLLLVSGGESWMGQGGKGEGDKKKSDLTEPFRNATHVTIPNAGHWVHHDQLDAFLTKTREFFVDT
jgi:pimeloyl-ACP methyl ester carboxylesterase